MLFFNILKEIFYCVLVERIVAIVIHDGHTHMYALYWPLDVHTLHPLEYTGVFVKTFQNIAHIITYCTV